MARFSKLTYALMASALSLPVFAASCAGHGSGATDVEGETTIAPPAPVMTFNTDSAFSYLKRQVDFGPRTPGSEAHAKCREWLAAELRRHGAMVEVKKSPVTTFKGENFTAYNIFASYNPDADNRLLLLAHYDTRPLADADANPANHSLPIDGANDGASGIGVLLELARAFKSADPGRGIDILFVDVEDSGSHEDEDSWALGARKFAQEAAAEGYRPSQAILLDMVGGKDAKFYREYFSEAADSQLLSEVWNTAERSGFGSQFINRQGGAVTDDHVELIKAGIPAIDIIEFNPSSATGFNPAWHTMQDNISNIDPESLKAVGQTLLNFIYGFNE